jgi:hypothetical protein
MLFEVDGNLEIKKLSVDKPKLFCELNVPTLDHDKNKVTIGSSIKKSKAKIEGLVK